MICGRTRKIKGDFLVLICKTDPLGISLSPKFVLTHPLSNLVSYEPLILDKR